MTWLYCSMVLLLSGCGWAYAQSASRPPILPAPTEVETKEVQELLKALRMKQQQYIQENREAPRKALLGQVRYFLQLPEQRMKSLTTELEKEYGRIDAQWPAKYDDVFFKQMIDLLREPNERDLQRIRNGQTYYSTGAVTDWVHEEEKKLMPLVLEKQLSQEEIARFRTAQVEHYRYARRVAVELLVSELDQVVKLTPAQRSAWELLAMEHLPPVERCGSLLSLLEKWAPLNQLLCLLNPVPEAKAKQHLDAEQLKVYDSRVKGNNYQYDRTLKQLELRP